MNNHSRSLPIVLLLLSSFMVLQGCTDSGLSEVQAFMDEEKGKKGPRIEPLPNARPYVASFYSSAGLKSPFDPPRDEANSDPQGNKVEAPDQNRVKEFLERFNIVELRMVGTMEQDGVRWALINDGTGSVHRVTAGNYLGRNHGLIDNVGTNGLELVEVVVDGRGGWIERPRSLSMTTE